MKTIFFPEKLSYFMSYPGAPHDRAGEGFEYRDEDGTSIFIILIFLESLRIIQDGQRAKNTKDLLQVGEQAHHLQGHPVQSW